MTATVEDTFQRPVGGLLRGWRERRRLSQLDLANQVDVSTRHVSFVETGRSRPSREMVLRLAAHEPYPALVVDRWWNIVEANAGIALFTKDVEPELLTAPINALRLTLHPDGLAGRITNLAEVRAKVMTNLHRQVAGTADPDLRGL